jgi:hypothetical protein
MKRSYKRNLNTDNYVKRVNDAMKELHKFKRLVERVIRMKDIDNLPYSTIALKLKLSSRQRAYVIYKSNKPQSEEINNMVKHPPF